MGPRTNGLVTKIISGIFRLGYKFLDASLTYAYENPILTATIFFSLSRNLESQPKLQPGILIRQPHCPYFEDQCVFLQTCYKEDELRINYTIFYSDVIRETVSLYHAKFIVYLEDHANFHHHQLKSHFVNSLTPNSTMGETILLEGMNPDEQHPCESLCAVRDSRDAYIGDQCNTVPQAFFLNISSYHTCKGWDDRKLITETVELGNADTKKRQPILSFVSLSIDVLRKDIIRFQENLLSTKVLNQNAILRFHSFIDKFNTQLQSDIPKEYLTLKTLEKFKAMASTLRLGRNDFSHLNSSSTLLLRITAEFRNKVILVNNNLVYEYRKSCDEYSRLRNKVLGNTLHSYESNPNRVSVFISTDNLFNPKTNKLRKSAIKELEGLPYIAVMPKKMG